MVFINHFSFRSWDLNGVPSNIVITFSSGDVVTYERRIDGTEEEKLQPSTNIELPDYDFGKFDVDDYDFSDKYAVCTRTLSTMMKQLKCSLEDAGRLRERAKTEIDHQYQTWEKNLRIDYSRQKEKWQNVKSELEAPEGRLRMVVKLLQESNLEKAPDVIKMLAIETEFVVKRMESIDLKFDTFMSHVQKASGDLCGRLSDALDNVGLTSWYDMNSVKLDIQGFIAGVIDSKIFTVVLTKDYFQREWCLFEYCLALVGTKPIVALHEADTRYEGGDLKEFHIPKQFKQIMKHEIIRIDRRRWRSFFSSFEQALRERQKSVNVFTDEIERIKSSSNILNKNSDIEFLRGALQSSGYKFGRRIFSSIADGFTVKIFHDNCDDKGATLTVVSQKNEIVFGVFLPISWESKKSDFFTEAPDAWLFDLEDQREPRLLTLELGQVEAGLCIKSGPIVRITKSTSGDEIGFGIHTGATFTRNVIKGIFAGNRKPGPKKMELDQYEVFQLIKIDLYAIV